MRVGPGIGEGRGVHLLVGVAAAGHGVEILGLPGAMVLGDEILDYGGQFGFVGAAQAVGDMAYDDAGALLGGEGVVGVDAILVFGEEGGIVDLADIVVERSGAHQLHIGADAVGGLGGEVAHCHGVLEGAGTFAREFAQGF